MLDRDLNPREILNDKNVTKLMEDIRSVSESILRQLGQAKNTDGPMGAVPLSDNAVKLMDKISVCCEEVKKLESDFERFGDIKKVCNLNNIRPVEYLNLLQVTGLTTENFSRLNLDGKEKDANALLILEKHYETEPTLKAEGAPLKSLSFFLKNGGYISDGRTFALWTLKNNFDKLIEERELEEAVLSAAKGTSEKEETLTWVNSETGIIEKGDPPRIQKGKL